MDAAGETLTEAVTRAVREEVEAVRARLRELPVRDGRPADEVLGYDEHGLQG